MGAALYYRQQYIPTLYICASEGFVYLSRRILITINLVESFFGSIESEFGRVVAARLKKIAIINWNSLHWAARQNIQKSLSHVHNWLHRGSGGCFVDDGPKTNNNVSTQSS